MLETFLEFTFEAAHQIPPFSGLHGHSFIATIYFSGERDPVYGWTHNLYEVEAALTGIKLRLNNVYLNEVEGLGVPSLENITVWIWDQIEKVVPGLDRVALRRGMAGAGEGCTYSGLARQRAA
jgi:6-pyruvoyltetrahydropterin/6-carboxytetrahydropterin synthase